MPKKQHYFSITLADSDGNLQNKTLSMPKREISAPQINSILEPYGDFQPAMLVSVNYLGKMSAYQFEHGVPQPGRYLTALTALVLLVAGGFVFTAVQHFSI